MYFDLQGPPSDRVVEGSTIHVGVSEIGYPFPAPTGIADYNLRNVGGDKPSATVIASAGPYDARGISIDGSIPLIGKELVLPIGISTQVSTQSSKDGAYYPGMTSRVTRIGATPQWTPNSHVTVRALIDWQKTSGAKTLPEFFAAGDVLPPLITKGYIAQNWAKGRNKTLNLGGLVTAQLAKNWLLRAGVFRSTNNNPAGFADLYTGIQPDGQSDHLVVGFRDQNASSTSGEVRLIGTFLTSHWRQQVILAARGRDTTAHFGGKDVVDLGPADISKIVQAPEPNFTFSARSADRARLGSLGAAYRVDWSSKGVLELGIQKEVYRETANSPGIPQSEISAHPFRAYANAAFAVTPKLTLYGGYTQGLENSGVAPNFAQNSGAVLPASLTWQFDLGARYAVTPKLKLIGGVFEVEKPYFNLDTSNFDRQLGVQQAKGVELSVAGEVTQNLNVNIGALAATVGITGPNLAAQGVGSIAIGQPHLTFVAAANYALPRWHTASIDVRFLYIGTAPETLDNRVSTSPASILNIGGRYKFTAFGRNNTLRVQIQNVLATNVWQQLSTPGVFQWPGPRRIFAYLTTDL
ncbi:TonB-dependent receptor domain-containing protein [Sphingomonas sp.]|uniref:TonB-dependent receptor domain-containing protein n=1 Tax=Sphingomonas sp. TaxID=28214 RepID=UPI0038A80F34